MAHASPPKRCEQTRNKKQENNGSKREEENGLCDDAGLVECMDTEENSIPPPDGGWGWFVVFGSFMIHIVSEYEKISSPSRLLS